MVISSFGSVLLVNGSDCGCVANQDQIYSARDAPRPQICRQRQLARVRPGQLPLTLALNVRRQFWAVPSHSRPVIEVHMLGELDDSSAVDVVLAG